jgi:SAM-dependent methyltransferase
VAELAETLNEFSRDYWYRIFLDPIAAELTAVEVDFIARQLPPAEFPTLLDVACGPGRHAAALVARGYRVLGVDVNPDAVACARTAVPRGAEFRALDMRELGSLAERFDGVTSLWHSFGYFDDAANEGVLRQMRARLRPGGRLLIDVYNRAHFAPMPREETSERNGERIETTRSWSGERLRVELRYASGGSTFEWRLYTPDELARALESVGFRVRLACAWFREAHAPSAAHARMQFVAERD